MCRYKYGNTTMLPYMAQGAVEMIIKKNNEVLDSAGRY